MQRELRNTGKERGQITAHRQAGAKPGNDTADHGLHNADAAFRHAQLNVVGPQRGRKTAAEHANDHHPVDAGQRCALKMDQFEVAPLFGMDACQL